MSTINLADLFNRLYALEGPQGWWPATDPIEISLGAILVQNTAWLNVDRALDQLRAHTAFNPEVILALPPSQLERLIRPSGFYKAKAKSIQALLAFYQEEQFDFNDLVDTVDDDLRHALLKLPGIGPETADVLLVYVFEQPVFIPDTYTRRLLTILAHKPITTYQQAQQTYSLPTDFTSAQAKEFHGLLDTFGKHYLRPGQRSLSDQEIRQLLC